MGARLSTKRQIKKDDRRKKPDKFDKAMDDIKKIGILSCCLVGIMLVVSLFIDPNESYAAGFLQQLPDSFISGMSEDGKALISDIYLPNEFYGKTSSNDRLSFIYCMDRRLGMIGNHNYVKGDSVKTAITLEGSSDNRSADYPGLIYILQHDELTDDSSVNYYLTQIAVWWYIDRANGFSDSLNYSSYDLSSGDASEENKFDEYGNYQFYNNLSAADKVAITNDATYGQKIVALVEEAVASENSYLVDNGVPDLIIDKNSITYNMTDNYVETSLIIPTSSNNSFDSYSVRINSSSFNVEIVDENNQPISSDNIEANKGFKLRISKEDAQSGNFSVNITIIGYYADLYDAFIYNPNPLYYEAEVEIGETFTEEMCTSSGNEIEISDTDERVCLVDTYLQRALLGIIEKPSSSLTIDLEVPTIDVPDTGIDAGIIYGIGTLIVIAGIVLIVVALKPKNAKER